MKASVNLLIVSASTDDCDLYGRLLSEVAGVTYQCTFAADAGMALALIGTAVFDCVLVEELLAGMDGLTLVRRIRQTAQFLPLVILAGQARDQLTAFIIEAGACSYIDKASIDRKQLDDAITAAIKAGAHVRRVAVQASLPLSSIDNNAGDCGHFARLLASGRLVPPVDVSSGMAGLALLREKDFEAILLNFGLPGIDGLEVMAKIRGEWPFVPVVFITGSGSVSLAVDALQTGAGDYLVKSTFDSEGLTRAIATSVMQCELASKDTQIRAKSEALLASEEYNRLLLDSVNEDTVIMLDPDGHVQTWNLASERIRGYTAEQILGQNFSVFFPPEDIAAGVPASILDFARINGRHSMEGWRVRKDGSRMFAGVVINAIRHETGNLIGFAHVVRDITELAAERTALHSANERIRLATDSGGIGIWDYHIGTGEVVWDHWMCRLYGLDPQEKLGGYDVWLRHLHPEDRAAAEQAMSEAIAGTAAFNAAFRIVWKDGSVHHIRGSGHLICDTAGVAVRMIGANWDVTEARELAATLAQQAERVAEARDVAEKASQAKSRFLAGMSHELRTPLNGILGNARLLQLEGGLQPAQIARLDTMLGAGSHLLEMIQCVLDLSEIETDRMALHAAPVDLRVVAKACLDMVRHMAVENGLALNFSVAADVPVLAIADPVRLRQILLNLLGNAAKFTGRGGIDLRLRTTADGASLRFDVADTGPGIPQEKRHRLFQDFMRLQSGDSRAVEGAGLGLALSARLAALMGGQIGHIENPGGGSIFWLELPLLACEAADPTCQTADAAQSGIGKNPGQPCHLHVLVVDDSEMNRDIASSFVRIMGHEVSCVGSGAEAVSALAATDFDVVFMDVQMPDMDGLEATRKIRALPCASAKVPVIALTAQVFTEQLAECRRAGMSGHLAKPFTAAALYATLAEFVPGAPRDHRSTIVAASDEEEADAPVIDLHVFRTNTRLLKPSSVTSYLANIVAGANAVLAALRAWGGSGEINDDVLKAAHKLAGNVGLFGFARAADAARRFERAARTGAPETRVLGDSLAAILQASIKEAEERLAAARVADRQISPRSTLLPLAVGGSANVQLR